MLINKIECKVAFRGEETQPRKVFAFKKGSVDTSYMAGDQLGKPEGQQIESVLVFAKGKDYKPAVRTKVAQVEKVNYFKSFMKLFKK